MTEKWEPAARSVWQELLQNDRARDVEACSKCLVRLCFLIASRELESEKRENSKKIVKIGGKIASKKESPEADSPNTNNFNEKRTNLATIETLLRKCGARLRLVPSKWRGDQPDEIEFRYPGVEKPMQNCVYCCIEGEKIAMMHCKENGWKSEAQVEEALRECGFSVFRPASSASLLIDVLQNLHDHVQLARDSPLLPNNVPKSWLPPHCCTCRRVASTPIKLYKLPCPGCESMFCCSLNCWSEHVRSVHGQTVEKKDKTKRKEEEDVGNEEEEEGLEEEGEEGLEEEGEEEEEEFDGEDEEDGEEGEDGEEEEEEEEEEE